MPVSIREKLGALSRGQEKLLKKLVEEKSRQSQQIRPHARAESSGQFAVASWAQQRLWFIDQLEGGSVAYNLPFEVSLQGALQPDCLQRALHALVEIGRAHV